ncbi:MAG: hypothetical protein CFE45_19500 [Burkholderiales bacterium PBB5]|nr:MAG: hypothetical protein CFE45_19500 [Burkholderiales bacterium PBB5]
MTTTRRQILWLMPAAALGATTVHAQPAKADENDPVAKGIGYKQDASKVDAAKYPTWAKGKVCSGCALYQGKAGEPWGACAIVGGKLVAAGGWCSAWSKKA